MTFMAETIVRSSLLLSIGFAALWILRGQSASLRHWVLAMSLMVATAMPALNTLLPAWSLALPGAMAVTSEDRPAGVVETATEFELPGRVVVVESRWPARIGVAWASGTALSIMALLAGVVWLWRVGRHSAPAGHAWTSVADSIAERLQLRAPVRIVVTQRPGLLVTWGVINPVILLPAGAESWPADRIRLVLAHEMAHVARRDWATQLSAELLRAIYWFNPLFWVACARLRSESEYACDDAVLDLGIARTSYASELVELARTFNVYGRSWLPAPSIARPSTLERRVRAMLNPRLNRRPVSATRRMLLAAMLLCAALPIAAASQAQSGTSGRVTDPSGKPLPDALVRLASITSDAAFEARSDANGNFQFGDVPPGEYMLSGRVPGFSSQRQRIQLNGAVTISLQMQVAKLTETVTVRGGDTPTPASRKEVTAPRTFTAPPCGNTEVGGNLKPPMKLRDVHPRYRQEWAASMTSGSVLLQATIGADGRVRNVEVISGGNAEMEEEAIAAVGQWEFSPTYLNCQAIEVRMFVTVNFQHER